MPVGLRSYPAVATPGGSGQIPGSAKNRGGLAGTANPAANYYNCTYGGPCGVTLPTTGNHFIYAAQPTVTVVANDLTWLLGSPGPNYSFSTTGLINGDTADTSLVYTWTTPTPIAAGELPDHRNVLFP